MDNHQANTSLFNQTTCCLALSLFVMLAAIYSLTYSGTFVTDDEHILAARTISLAYDDQINNSRVSGNSRVFELSQLSPEAVNIEPGQMILGTLLVRLASALHIGQVQALFLMNIWGSAFCAVGLFLIILVIGYSHRTALTVSLFFGSGTIIWPYSRTYFRDPLAMLFLLCAWFFIELYLSKRQGTLNKGKVVLLWMGFVVSVVAGILTKNTITIALPVFFFRLVEAAFNHQIQPYKILKRIWIPATFIALLIFGWIIFLPSFKLFSRFTFNYYSFLFDFFTTTPHPGLLEALTGPFLSPGKSIFLFSPILLLSLISLFTHRKNAWPGWLYLVLLITGQALFYNTDWTGKVNWGLRFTLPAIPLLTIGSAPVVDSWLKSARGRIGLSLLAAISVPIQLAGVLPPIEKYYVELASMIPSVSNSAIIWDPRYSILFWSFKWLLSGEQLNIAIVRIPGPSTIRIVAGLIIGILLALVNFRMTRKWIGIISLGLCLGLTVCMLFVYRDDPTWYHTRMDLQAAQSTISREYQTGDFVLIKSYGSPVWDYWLNWSDPPIRFTALPYVFPNMALLANYQETHNPADVLDKITLKILEEIPENHRVWLVVPSDSPGADLNLELKWLLQHATQTQVWTFEDNEQVTRLYLFKSY